VQMSEASKRGDKARLSALLPQVRGHALEPWGVYWEMKARLGEASAAEIQATMQSIAGTYQEDRLRNDWLQLLGQRRDWQTFSSEYAKYRMHDDREVRCYAIHIDRLRGAIGGEAAAQEVLRNWYGIRDAEDGCTLAAGGLLEAKLITALDVWKEARLSIEGNRPRAASNAVTLVSPDQCQPRALPQRPHHRRWQHPQRARHTRAHQNGEQRCRSGGGRTRDQMVRASHARGAQLGLGCDWQAG
jgi:soluble lytic murein transglycosylase